MRGELGKPSESLILPPFDGNMAKHAIVILTSVLLSACGAGVRTDRPLSLSEAKQRKETDFPFPPSASNIYYATFGDFQAYEYLLRFDAPPVDCEATIARALAWHAATNQTTVPYQAVSVSTPTALPETVYLERVWWWDGMVVEHGLLVGEDSSHRPTIWIDLDHGRFYYRYTD
jgi:hypothetical protein